MELDDQQKHDLGQLGYDQLKTLAPEFRRFVLYLWKLSHYGALDTFSYIGNDPTFLSLLHTDVLELVDRVGDRYRVRFDLNWRKWLDYTNFHRELGRLD
jgi:hypothetical protein